LNSHQDIIEKLNAFGKMQKPFIFFIDFEMEKPRLFSLEELEQEEIQIHFPTFQTKKIEYDATKIELQITPSTMQEYADLFSAVQQNLQQGNSYLTNLTVQTPIHLSTELEPIFQQAKAKYKIQFTSEWVCFSPETFIEIKGNKIYAYPMKGTIDASISNAEQVLLQDKKETAEHYTIVDLIRNDLSIVATDVRVEKFRYIETITTAQKNLLQMSSQISGVLPENFQEHLGTILYSLLPAGSISGAPKKKTVDIIHEVEKESRGYYTGVCFYYDGENVDSCVLIRFIEKTATGFVYKSGGGITIHSEVEKEYQELLDKIYVPVF